MTLGVACTIFVFIFIYQSGSVVSKNAHITECSLNKTVQECNTTALVYYCFPDTTNDGCFPPVNCLPGNYVVINPPINATQPRSFTCKKCPDGQTSKFNNSLKCENICPDGQVVVESRGDVVGDDNCREKTVTWNTSFIIYIICGVVGVILLGIIAWRCIRYAPCYRKRVREAKAGRHACAACCRQYICLACCTLCGEKTTYGVENVQASTGSPYEASSNSVASGSTRNEAFVNLAYSDKSLDKY